MPNSRFQRWKVCSLMAHRYDRRSSLLGLTQYADLLLGGVSLSFHNLGPF
jgi:hypothetical protein